jgi:opacity protein-like surface antigen
MVRSYVLSGVAAVATAAFLFSSPASAADIAVEPEPVVNWYLSLHGGIKFGEDWDDSFTHKCGPLCPVEEIDLSAEADNGWRFGGALGYMLGDAFAIEGELAYMEQDFDDFEVDGNKQLSFDFDGDVSIFTGMINLLAGFPLGGFLRPYVGAGAGFAHVSLDDIGDGFLDDNDTSFAIQGFVGLDVGISENVALGIRGRALHIGDLEFDDEDDFGHDVDVDLIKSVEAVLTFGF